MIIGSDATEWEGKSTNRSNISDLNSKIQIEKQEVTVYQWMTRKYIEWSKWVVNESDKVLSILMVFWHKCQKTKKKKKENKIIQQSRDESCMLGLTSTPKYNEAAQAQTNTSSALGESSLRAHKLA